MSKSDSAKILAAIVIAIMGIAIVAGTIKRANGTTSALDLLAIYPALSPQYDTPLAFVVTDGPSLLINRPKWKPKEQKKGRFDDCWVEYRNGSSIMVCPH